MALLLAISEEDWHYIGALRGPYKTTVQACTMCTMGLWASISYILYIRKRALSPFCIYWMHTCCCFLEKIACFFTLHKNVMHFASYFSGKKRKKYDIKRTNFASVVTSYWLFHQCYMHARLQSQSMPAVPSKKLSCQLLNLSSKKVVSIF